MSISKTNTKSFQMVIFYILLGAFALGAGAVASANLSENPGRRR